MRVHLLLFVFGLVGDGVALYVRMRLPLFPISLSLSLFLSLSLSRSLSLALYLSYPSTDPRGQADLPLCSLTAKILVGGWVSGCGESCRRARCDIGPGAYAHVCALIFSSRVAELKAQVESLAQIRVQRDLLLGEHLRPGWHALRNAGLDLTLRLSVTGSGPSGQAGGDRSPREAGRGGTPPAARNDSQGPVASPAAWSCSPFRLPAMLDALGNKN